MKKKKKKKKKRGRGQDLYISWRFSSVHVESRLLLGFAGSIDLIQRRIDLRESHRAERAERRDTSSENRK